MAIQPRKVLTSRRHKVARACLAGLILFTLVSVYSLFGYIYYEATGRLIGSFTASEMSGEGMASPALGYYVVLLVGLAWGAWPLIGRGWVRSSDKVERARAASPSPADSRASTGPDPARPPPPAPVDLPASGGTAGPRTRDLPEQRVPGSDELDRLDADPQLALIGDLLARLFDDRALREHEFITESERRNNRRDLVLMGVGTVLGVVAPVISAPLLRLIQL